jgi:Glycosyltransferase family 87
MPLYKSRIKITFRHIVILYLLTAVIASIQCYFGNIIPSGQSGRMYTNYNNFVLFRNSFFHLIQGKDLYISYPDEQWDLYKYSPTFSLVFGLFAYLPDFIGLFFWNLVNTIPLLIGFSQLKGISDNSRIYMALFCVIELSGNLQNTQSNGLIAALLILTFTSLENGKYLLAAFFVVFSMFIKIYGGIGIVLFLFYPSKTRLMIYTMFWFLLLGVLPLLVIDLKQLAYLYRSWVILLKADRVNSTGISVMGILKTWFKFGISKNIVEYAGIVLFLLPLMQIRKYKFYDFRLLTLCSALIWVVIFNHKAESPTYIISICGIAIWFFSRPRTSVNIVLVILAIIFTTLSLGELFPYYIRQEFIKPYCIKGLFSIVIFGKIFYELFGSDLSQGSLSPRVSTEQILAD